MLMNTNPAPRSTTYVAEEATMSTTPTTFFPTVDMGEAGLVTVEVKALTYMDAYKGAVEQLLVDPEGTMLHALRARMTGDM